MKLVILFLLALPLWVVPQAAYLLVNGHFEGIGAFFLLVPLHSLGTTLGYHRLLAHNAYDPKPWFKKLIILLGTLNLQGPPISWASVHLKHHRFSDTEHDPHSPAKGLWHAYGGWLFDFGFSGHTDVKRLISDPYVRFLEKHYLLLNVVYLLFLASISVSVLFWGGLARICFINTVTWLVNALCHYPKHNTWQSINKPIFAILSFGEGMHANHHAKAINPFFGKGLQDLGGMFLKCLQKFGVVKI